MERIGHRASSTQHKRHARLPPPLHPAGLLGPPPEVSHFFPEPKHVKQIFSMQAWCMKETNPADRDREATAAQ